MVLLRFTNLHKHRNIYSQIRNVHFSLHLILKILSTSFSILFFFSLPYYYLHCFLLLVLSPVFIFSIQSLPNPFYPTNSSITGHPLSPSIIRMSLIICFNIAFYSFIFFVDVFFPFALLSFHFRSLHFTIFSFIIILFFFLSFSVVLMFCYYPLPVWDNSPSSLLQ